MVEKVRGKFFVIGIRKDRYQPAAPATIELAAVSASDKEKAENCMFHKYTPFGEIKMQIDNPPASSVFELGQEFYVDFTPIEKQ